MEINNSTVTNNVFDFTIGGFDDEVDCAIIGDQDMQDALAALEKDPNATIVDEEIDMGSSDAIDPSVDYSEDVVSADFTDMDADDIIAAERDMAYDPFKDDELIDAATGGDDEYVDTDNNDE